MIAALTRASRIRPDWHGDKLPWPNLAARFYDRKLQAAGTGNRMPTPKVFEEVVRKSRIALRGPGDYERRICLPFTPHAAPDKKQHTAAWYKITRTRDAWTALNPRRSTNLLFSDRL